MPVRKEELVDRPGKQPDGSSKTREVKLVTVWSAEGRVKKGTPVRDEFGYAEMAVVALADLYAGKICAALDRQHPRDLYDVMLLLDEEGFTDDIRRALLVYIVSHSRPMAELLAPNRKDIRTIYENEFRQMTEEEVSLEALEETRERRRSV